jgi:galactokinase/mevalonate kinase-like predicted kinase
MKDGMNWFVYCSNKPLENIDQTGLEEKTVTIVTGTTKDDKQVSISVDKNDNEGQESAQNAYEGMKELGWKVKKYEAKVDVTHWFFEFLGVKPTYKIKGLSEVNENGEISEVLINENKGINIPEEVVNSFTDQLVTDPS